MPSADRRHGHRFLVPTREKSCVYLSSSSVQFGIATRFRDHEVKSYVLVHQEAKANNWLCVVGCTIEISVVEAPSDDHANVTGKELSHGR
jgi:hypothetical protein